MTTYTNLNHEQSLQLIYDFMLNGEIKPNAQTLATISLLTGLKGFELYDLISQSTYNAKTGLNTECVAYGVALQSIALKEA